MAKLLLITLLLAATLTAPVAADISTGLVAWYPFDGDTQDASGNGNHGSAVGGLMATADRTGAPNTAYEFNGTNSYVLVPNSASLSLPDTALTQAAWVLFYGPSQVGQAFGPITMKSASTANSFMYRMLATPAAGVGVAFNDWFNQYSTSYPFVVDQWYHVASVFDGSSVRFYVNGSRIDSVSAITSIAPSAYDFTIGADVPGILEIFYGKIDDVRIYSRALTDEDVAELCDCDPTGVGDTPAIPSSRITRTYPNPFNGRTRVDFFLQSDATVELSVYDVAGRRIRLLLATALPGGDHVAAWDGRDAAGSVVPSGVYFVRMTADGRVTSRRIVHVR